MGKAEIVNTEYKGVFKSTFLFSFVRVFQILTGILRNKAVATILGAEGIGIISILTNSANLIQNGASLGIPQSAIRDLSDLKEKGDESKLSLIISITTRLVFLTSLFGALITVILSPLLSNWTFGNNNYVYVYIGLSLFVFFNIIKEGQLTILKGLRNLKQLAISSLLGSVIGLIFSIPLYYVYGKNGILPSLVITGIASFIIPHIYVRRIFVKKINPSFSEMKSHGRGMITMGMALMLISFLGLLFELIIAAYIRYRSGIEMVGYYRSGTTIITSYFGIIITAMTTEYYPRISSIYKNNSRISIEMNRQIEVGLIMVMPIAVLFIILSPTLIKLLYSNDFTPTIQYTDYAILGIVLVIVSNCLGIILLAKQEVKIFTLFAVSHRVVFIPIFIVLYNNYGLIGLSIGYVSNTFIQLLINTIVLRIKFGINLNKSSIVLIAVVLSALILSVFVRNIENAIIQNALSIFLFVITTIYSVYYARQKMNINILRLLLNRKL